MRGPDETPLDPEVAAALDALDATLAGEPVDPDHAELAELALLLADERPRPDPAFTAGLDGRVGHRFARARPARRRRLLVWAPAGGLAAAVAVTVVIVASGSSTSPAPHVPELLSGGVSTSAAPQAARAPANGRGAPASSGATASGRVAGASGAAASGPPALQPTPNGRKLVQAAQLSLTTSPSRVDDVAQEVFDVVGRQKGIVSNSSVTAGGTGGYAQFQLSVPSASLGQTMAALSALQYAHVASRTDTTQDVNDQYLADVRRLADARVLRTSLLKQLANATTQAQIDSLTARIHDAEASISSDEATLRQLNRQIAFSQVTLTVSAGSAPGPVSHGGGGFTLGRAAHDAGRVLAVAAGVVLIVAAALVPLALIAAVGWWIATLVRRRRREQALDAI